MKPPLRTPASARRHASGSDPEAAVAGLRILVRGGGDVGSAVAHALHAHGHQVLIGERPGSCHARRGMAFTDALYDGTASLDGLQAVLQPDLAGITHCWQQGGVIPIVVLSEQALLDALEFDVLVDATLRRGEAPADLRPLAALTVGIGPGYAPGRNCHFAVESQWGPAMGQVLHDMPAAARSGGPPPLGGVARERFSVAPAAGPWEAVAAIGQSVQRGEVLGYVAGHAVTASIDGVLRGIAHDGAAIGAGQRIAEVDPRSAAPTSGRGERPLAVAAGVLSVLDHHGRLP